MKKDSVPLSGSEAMQYLELAYASEEQSEFEKALEECDTAIRIDPCLADAHNLRGVILEELGRREEAVLAYHEAIRLDSGFREARENLRDIEAELKEDRYRSLQIRGKGFGIRAIAYSIDTLVIYGSSFAAGILGGLALGIVMLIVFELTGREFYLSEKSTQWLGIIAGLVLFVFYFTIFEWVFGATLGKLILGLRVVKESGEPCDFRVSFVRALWRFIDGFFFAIPAYRSMKSPLYQRIGDKKVGTIVVGSKESVIQQPRAWWRFLVAMVFYFAIATVSAFILTGMALR